MEKIENIISSLSPIERKIMPFLGLSVNKIIENSGLNKTSVLRALKFLENKDLVKIKHDKKQIVDLGVNGVYYKKNQLPERKLLTLLGSKNYLPIEEAKKLSKLSNNEFKVSLGVLKGKDLITLSNGKISLKASREELIKRFPEEKLLDLLPVEKNKLSPEELFALNNLQKRKNILELAEKKDISFDLKEDSW